MYDVQVIPSGDVTVMFELWLIAQNTSKSDDQHIELQLTFSGNVL